jgi:biopolymer transport protein ExbD
MAGDSLMFDSLQKKRSSDADVSIDMTPLIDVVFILLLFFLVTTTFIKETGIEVNRPEASLGAALDAESLRVGIAASGGIYVDGRHVDLAGVHEAVTEKTSVNSEVGIVVVPDEQVPSGRLIAVMDTVKAAGASNVAVATRRKGSL